jgi:hypothetical protein
MEEEANNLFTESLPVAEDKLKKKRESKVKGDDPSKPLKIAKAKKSIKKQKLVENEDDPKEDSVDISKHKEKSKLERENEEYEKLKKDCIQGPDMAPNGVIIPEVDIDAYSVADEGMDCIRKYAKSIGFVIKIERSWTGYKRCICNRNAKQLVGEPKIGGRRKECPWIAIIKRDHDQMWRFKRIFNYHNHEHTGVVERVSEKVDESSKAIPKEIREKIDFWYFDLGKSVKDIVNEFKSSDSGEGKKIDEDRKEEKQDESEDNKDENEGTNNEESDEKLTRKDPIEESNIVEEEPSKAPETSQNPTFQQEDSLLKPKFDSTIRISSINTHLASFTYPKDEDFSNFISSLSSPAHRPAFLSLSKDLQT